MFDFLANRFSAAFAAITGTGSLTESSMHTAIEQVRDALLQADVPAQAVDAFIADVKLHATGKKILKGLKPGEQFIKVVHERLQHFLGNGDSSEFSFQLPATVLVMGLQGSGKTTTVAKMAYWAREKAKARGKQRRILLASVDFYRPAAIEQLELLAKQIGVDFYRSPSAQSVGAAQDIMRYAKKEQFELTFVDTAGRMHIDEPLLAELKGVAAAVSPTYKILVLDAMTGQESLSIAQSFDAAVGFNQAILTKIDSDTRAGAAFAFRYIQKKPIVFIGSGEKMADLELFRPERMASRILGMGDVLTLIEKAEESIQVADQERLQKKFIQGTMTLQDFADQIGMVSKLGSLSQISKYLPGLGGAALSQETLDRGEADLKKFKAIIGSMTHKERVHYRILDGSRKQRIAHGAGVTVTDINLFLKRFEESQQYARLFKRFLR